MNNQRIVDWVDGRFAGFAQTDKVREQKEELETHMVDRIREHMANSMDFEQAFIAAKEDLGDLDELLTGFEHKKKMERPAPLPPSTRPFNSQEIANAAVEYAHSADSEVVDDFEIDAGRWRFRVNHEGLVALSPFIYLLLGFAFNWWAWGWMVIPVSAIVLCAGDDIRHKLVALSPFVYIALGVAFNWWAWGWIIIPLSAIVLEGHFFSVSYRKE